MLTGNLVLARVTRDRVVPRYLDANRADWLEAAENLLAIFREAAAAGLSRGAIEAEVEELLGGETGGTALVLRGLAKVLEDRAEFEVVADVPPETLREKVFAAAAAHRVHLKEQGPRPMFRRDEVLQGVGDALGLPPDRVAAGLFADLKDENRILSFDPLEPRTLLDRYNVALAQAVLLRSVWVRAEVRNETAPRYRQLFRWMKFHRLLHRAEPLSGGGYRLHVDGPLSLFSATTRYGLQMALFLPALLRCRDYRLEAELRWGPRREPRAFLLTADDGLVPTHDGAGQYVPAEIAAFLERFRQLAPEWDVRDDPEIVDLSGDGVWVPDYRFVHRRSGAEVLVEVLGFWKRASVERLLSALPGLRRRFVLLVSDRLKVDEAAFDPAAGTGAVVRFKEIPSAPELLARLEAAIAGDGGGGGGLFDRPRRR